MSKPLTIQAMGRKGGKARKKNLTKAQLSAIGRLGAKARWKKLNEKKARIAKFSGKILSYLG